MKRSDINRATWEDSEVPAVCEACLGSNPYIRMIREKYGEECKLCTRPFTMFRWLPEKGSKYKRTAICLTCARQRNCCQSCMLDLTYGLPIALRDAALKMVGSGSSVHENSNAVIKQYIAQNFEASEEASLDGAKRRALEESEAAKKLLQSLATALPYYKQKHKQHPQLAERSQLPTETSTAGKILAQEVGKIASKLPLSGNPVPPADKSITSLFIMGIEDDLPENLIVNHFKQFGNVVSIVCIHRARCAFITFSSRASAELAAVKGTKPEGSGKFIIKGCKLRLAWSKPRPLGSSHSEHTKLGQIVKKAMKQLDVKERNARNKGIKSSGSTSTNTADVKQVPLPPGATKTSYRSQHANFEA